jgi:hypothetical protein
LFFGFGLWRCAGKAIARRWSQSVPRRPGRTWLGEDSTHFARANALCDCPRRNPAGVDGISEIADEAVMPRVLAVTFLADVLSASHAGAAVVNATVDVTRPGVTADQTRKSSESERWQQFGKIFKTTHTPLEEKGPIAGDGMHFRVAPPGTVLLTVTP